MALDLKNIDLKNINVRNIYEWPAYGRVFVLGLVCMVLFYLGYLFDFSALSDQIYARFKQEQDLKQQIHSILKTREDMREVVLQFPEILKLLNQWQGQLISSTALPDLLNQILKIGADNHLQFALFTPGAKKREDDYFMVPIKVLARGNYNQMANFISQVANLPQVVAIGDFIIANGMNVATSAEKEPSEGDTTNNLTMALTLEVYYLANKE